MIGGARHTGSRDKKNDNAHAHGENPEMLHFTNSSNLEVTCVRITRLTVIVLFFFFLRQEQVSRCQVEQ